jgi:C-terminal processing protease CtpA/Prc
LYLVTDVVPASPAAVAGMHINDTVQTINDTAIALFTQDRISSLLSGEADQSVTFGISRQTGLDTITVTYAAFNDRSVTMCWIDSSIVYIGVKVFASQTCLAGGTAQELAAALDSSCAAKYTIIDLRNTTGGDFDQCRTAAGYFVSGPCQLADLRERVYDQLARLGQTCDTTWTASDSGRAAARTCYLLINNVTSQAAEVFIAAVHANRSDVLSVGTKTAGNARAQHCFDTPDSGLAVITTTLYAPPGSPTFDGTGIAPRYPILPGSDALDVVRLLIGYRKDLL